MARVDLDAELVVGRVGGDQVDLAVDELADVDGLRVELHPAAVPLLRREEALDQAREPLALVVDDLDVLLHGLAVLFGVALQQQPRVPEDAGQRRAQLVRDDRDQLRLRPLALP